MWQSMLKCFFTPFFTGVWEKLLRFLLIIYSLNYRGSEVPASRGHGWCTWTPTGAVQCFHWELQYSHSIILSKAAAWLLPTKGRPVPNPCSASLAEKTYSLFYFFFFFSNIWYIRTNLKIPEWDITSHVLLSRDFIHLSFIWRLLIKIYSCH